MYSIQDLQNLFDTPVERIGGNYRVLCPFHKENTPSLILSNRTGHYKCFGCGEFGKIKDLPKKLGKILDLRDELFETKDVFSKNDIKPIDMDYIELCHNNLKIYQQLYDRVFSRVPHELTINKYKLGYSLDRGRYTIPIIENGVCVNVKLIAFGHRIKQMNWKKGYGKPRLYLYEEILNSEKVIICAGEWDCLLLKSMGFPAVTSTSGENSWSKDWNEYFYEKEVYIVYDQDEAGDKGRKNIAKNLFSDVKSIKIVDFDIDMGEGGDVSDYFLKFGKSIKDFKLCLQKAGLYFPDERIKLFGYK